MTFDLSLEFWCDLSLLLAYVQVASTAIFGTYVSGHQTIGRIFATSDGIRVERKNGGRTEQGRAHFLIDKENLIRIVFDSEAEAHLVTINASQNQLTWPEGTTWNRKVCAVLFNLLVPHFTQTLFFFSYLHSPSPRPSLRTVLHLLLSAGSRATRSGCVRRRRVAPVAGSSCATSTRRPSCCRRPRCYATATPITDLSSE